MEDSEEGDMDYVEEGGEEEMGMGMGMGMGMEEEIDDEEGEEEDNYYEEDQSAPVYTVPQREVVAVEHPLIVQNLENGIKTFGRAPNWNKVLEGTEDECLPLYLRFRDPTCEPILSYNSITNNVLLKITVPKRTGRKRKRGSKDPYTDDGQSKPAAGDDQDSSNIIRSHSRNDKPASILRKLQDNVDKYTVEAVGAIEQSHRYRGLADYHHSTSSAPFMSHFRDTAFSADWGKMREFKLGTSKGWRPNEEIIPPPTYTHHPLPFNWAYRQNPLITSEVDAVTGETKVINRSKMPKLEMYYIHNDESEIPTQPPHPIPADPVLKDFVVALQQAMTERPIWTRRALTNRLANEPGLYLMKPALQYVGYQFRSGPWRDAVIRYGVDPRKDSYYRIYQTLFFKLYDFDERAPDGAWKDIRSQYTKDHVYGTGDCPSHMFNGTSLILDGKVWQVCDITDPLLVPLIHNAPMSTEYDGNSDGYYTNGSIAKIRAIMKTKLLAIRGKKTIPEDAFNVALSIPDFVPNKKGKKVHVPVPDMRLTDEEIAELRANGVISGMSGKGIRRLDSRSKRKKYGKHRKERAATYGMMKGPKPKHSSTSTSTTRKKPISDGKNAVVTTADGDISVRDAMKTMDEEWGGELEEEELEEEELGEVEEEEERGEDEYGSENETTASEDDSEAEAEKEMFRRNYEARSGEAAPANQNSS